MHWNRVAMVLMIASSGGCAPTGEPELDPVVEASTGPGTTAPVGSSGSTTGDGETDELLTTSTETGPYLDTETDGETEGEPPQQCTSTACTTTCIRPLELENEAGEVCACDRAEYPTGYARCDLGDPCEGDRLCIVQAVRYGVVGTYRLDDFTDTEHFTLTIDVLGEGRARSHATGWTHDCCGGTDVNEYGTFFHPQDVVASDDDMWRECIRLYAPAFETIPECLLPENMFAGSCEPPLLECPPLPEPPDSADACRESCPMAHDDVCDERAGTALCGEGCDTADCTCTEDVPGQCDAGYGDPGCPLASDADCG